MKAQRDNTWEDRESSERTRTAPSGSSFLCAYADRGRVVLEWCRWDFGFALFPFLFKHKESSFHSGKMTPLELSSLLIKKKKPSQTKSYPMCLSLDLTIAAISLQLAMVSLKKKNHYFLCLSLLSARITGITISFFSFVFD